MHVSSIMHGHWAMQTGQSGAACESTPAASVAQPADTVELSSAAVAANAAPTPDAPAPEAPAAPTPPDAMPAAPTPDDAAPVAPDPTPAEPTKATGHARVAQNFERHFDRMIGRAEKRLGERFADLRGMFDQIAKVLQGFKADPSMRPSDVMKQIHQIMRDWRHGAPTPTTPTPAPTPIDPPTPAPEAKPAAPDAMPAAPTPDEPTAPVAPAPTPDEPAAPTGPVAPTPDAPIVPMPMPMAQEPGVGTSTDLGGGMVSPLTRAQVTVAYSVTRATFSFSIAA
jgi:pyruvate dehydrogenase E2 component (dihydrolipoyllysine-residue acetyltransferase)